LAIDSKLTLSRIFFQLFLVLTLVVLAFFYIQYSSAKKVLTQNFINKHNLDSIKIKDSFKTIYDSIQYKLKLRQPIDIEILKEIKWYIFTKQLNKIPPLLKTNSPSESYDLVVFQGDKLIYSTIKNPKKFHATTKLQIDTTFDIKTFKMKKIYTLSYKGYNIKLIFNLDIYKDAKKTYQSLFNNYKDLKILKIYFIKDNLIYPINFDNKQNEEAKPITLKNLIEEIQKDLKVYVPLKNDLKETLNELLSQQKFRFDEENNYFIVYEMIEDIFKCNNALLIKEIFSTKDLLKSIQAIKNRFILLILLIIIIMGAGYYFIMRKISKEISIIVESITKNKEIDERSTIKEIEILKKEYNKFRNRLNEEINKNIKLLEENKRFILDTIHQIKTPLSIITLNIDFIKHQVTQPEINEVIEEIEAAVTMLTNSYEDLSYLAGNGILKYEAKIDINIADVLKERVKFFESVAKANHKKIHLDIEDKHFLINKIELERIIDNNLSNAIKYSTKDDIFITLKKGILRFESYGDKIKNPKMVFEKNYREHSHKRGLGIGLNIVKDICEKYNIEYRLYYRDGKNIFEYIFKEEDDDFM